MTGAKQVEALKVSIMIMSVIMLLFTGCSTLKKDDKATTATTASKYSTNKSADPVSRTISVKPSQPKKTAGVNTRVQISIMWE